MFLPRLWIRHWWTLIETSMVRHLLPSQDLVNWGGVWTVSRRASIKSCALISRNSASLDTCLELIRDRSDSNIIEENLKGSSKFQQILELFWEFASVHISQYIEQLKYNIIFPYTEIPLGNNNKIILIEMNLKFSKKKKIRNVIRANYFFFAFYFPERFFESQK